MPKQTYEEKVDAIQVRHLSQLIGRTVTGLVMDQSDRSIGSFFGLKFNDGKIAWIQCDPEGNGPGHLDIVKTKAMKP